jgi:xylulokinase
MKDLLLGIDIGTTSAKAALFSDDGVLLSAQQAEYPLHHVQAGWVEQEPDDWWRAASQAIRMALSDVPHAADRMAGIAVSAQAPTLLPLDASLHPLRRALIWMDRRAGNEADFLASTFGYDSIVRDTGNRPDAFYVAPRLLWFRRHEPDLFARTRLFMQINGYIALRLTGKPGMDPVHAALLGLRHHASGQWLADICDACGVSPDLFPAVLDGHSLQGHETGRRCHRTATGHASHGRHGRWCRRCIGSWSRRCGPGCGNDRHVHGADVSQHDRRG